MYGSSKISFRNKSLAIKRLSVDLTILCSRKLERLSECFSIVKIAENFADNSYYSINISEIAKETEDASK